MRSACDCARGGDFLVLLRFAIRCDKGDRFIVRCGPSMGPGHSFRVPGLFFFLFGAVRSVRDSRGQLACRSAPYRFRFELDALLAYGLRLVDRLESDWQERFPESEHDMSEAGMLREMKIDEGAEGLFVLALRRPAKEDGLSGEYGSGIVRGEFHAVAECRR